MTISDQLDLLLKELAEREGSAAADRSAARADRAEISSEMLLEEVHPEAPRSTTPVSQAAVDLIVASEVSSRAWYERQLTHPVWPKGQSGLTIGIGYDVGYVDQPTLEADWTSALTDAMMDLLRPACLVRGQAAVPFVKAAEMVAVDWNTAMQVFLNTSLPEFVATTEHALSNTDELHPDCLGALASLTYNRGPSYKSSGPRYAEMRAIRAHMASRNFQRIPTEMRAMTRIWAGDPSLRGVVLRREAEALLFERGLAAPRREMAAFRSESPGEGVLGWLGGWMRGIIEEPTRDRLMVRLDGPEADAPIIEPDEHYVAVRVLSARVVNARRWTSTYHGAVHATCNMLYEGQGSQRLERSAVLAPDGFRDLDPSGQGKLLQVDRALFGPMPYRGDLRLAVALFSIKSSDLAGPFLSLISDLSQTAALGFLAAAQPFVAPLRLAVDTLFGTTGSASLECGTVRGFSPLRAGTWACIGATRHDYPDTTGFQLSQDSMRLLDGRGDPVEGAPYLVFRIERLERREDYLEVPELKLAWDEITAALKTGDIDNAMVAAKAFRRLCFAGGDLTSADARRVAARADQKVRQALESV